jgi:SAM-dependent methyltransferase
MIHGAYEGLSRSSIFFTPGHITISKLYTTHLAKNEDRAYYFAARKICSDTRHAFKLFYEDEENPRFYRSRVMGNFIYKGPVLENYMRIKLRLENNYRLMHELIPRKATITDIGCGYGAMDFMLCLKSNERRITGIDYDKAKIAIALACSITRNYALSFVAGDALDVPLTRSDVFLLSDMLHYLPPDKQTLLLGNCLDKLNAGGRIIIRDSDSSLKRRHRGTRLSEFLSTGLGFNKARFKLSFVSRGFVAEFAEKHDLRLRIIDNTRFNSNVVYLLSLP